MPWGLAPRQAVARKEKKRGNYQGGKGYKRLQRTSGGVCTLMFQSVLAEKTSKAMVRCVLVDQNRGGEFENSGDAGVGGGPEEPGDEGNFSKI